MASKPKSALSETPNKSSPVTPRVSKPSSRGFGKSETDSHSPLQSSRLSVDRSPRSLPPKTTIERRSPKLATPPEKQPSRLAKGSELQAQLSTAQEDLKKAKQQIVLAEKEKEKALEELKEAERVAEEANEKLREAVVAQKRAEESSEIEKFRAVELEQVGIEATQKKDEEWEKAIESVKTQHAMDVSTLHSITEELQRLKQELAMTWDAKNQALSHADEATKVAEIHAEKAETLLDELNQLKTMLDSKNETESSQKHKIVMELTSEVALLRQELEKAKCFEKKLKEKESSIEQLNLELVKAKSFEVKLVEKEASIQQLNVELEKAKSFEVKLVEKEASIEQLNVELEAARMAESYARSVVEELKSNVDELERQVKEAHRLERSASESLESVMKQLKENKDMLHGARTEVISLKGKMGLLEITIDRQKVDLEESDLSLGMAKDETSEMAKLVESLKSELQAVKEEKKQALNNEKLAASKVQTLIEEKTKLASELENSRDEEEKSKKAMESLASALHEVSAEAREANEKLLSGLVEHESHESQIEDLKLILKATNEKYESLLDEAKHEMDSLTSTLERSKADLNDSRGEWEDKEIHLVSCVKKSEEENSSLQSEVNRLVSLLNLEKELEAQLKDSLKEVESEAIYLQEALAEAKAESTKLKESVLDKETELQNIAHENEELQAKEASALKRAEELSKSLEEAAAAAKKQSSENGEVSDTEKDYDLLPKVVEFSEENGHLREVEELKLVNDGSEDFGLTEIDHSNGKSEKEEEKKGESVEAVETEYKMWESVKIEKKEFSPEREAEGESFDDEADSKVSGGIGESFDQTNGVLSSENNASPTQEQKQPKKKKPLLRKFGSLLKKKGSSTVK